jgi:hypothetical protein
MLVMAGLVPAIHVFNLRGKVVDGRNCARHDGDGFGYRRLRQRLSKVRGKVAEQGIVHARLLQVPERP